MENSKLEVEEEVYVKNNELNVYENVHLFFYTYIDGELFLLLNKNGENGEFKEFYTEILPSDELPTFSIARLMATTYRGLFSVKNLEKLKKGEEITEQDLLPSDEYLWYDIWNNEVFIDWLDKISENHIQYDVIKGKMIYFINLEIENLEKIEQLNICLDKIRRNSEMNNTLPFNYSFYLFKYNYSFIPQIDSKEYSLNKNSYNLMQKFDFDAFIKETIQMFKEDKVDYYLIVACKKQGKKKDQAGFFHFPALLPGMYRKNNEKWIYLLASGELPSEELLSRAKAIIIPGSELNIYHDEQFLRKTELWLKNTIENHPKIKFLGLCFGMQLYVNAMGGKVENMGEGIFIRGAEKLDFDQEFWNLNYVKHSGVEKCQSLVVRQAHGDLVTKLPEDNVHKIKVLAGSNSCKIEVLASEDERILCFQGHPEYATEFSNCRAASWVCVRMKLEVNPENMIKVRDMMLKEDKYPHVNTVELRKICNSFLKN